MNCNVAALLLTACCCSHVAVAEVVTLEHQGLTLNANLEKGDGWPDGTMVLMTHGTLAHRGMEIMASLQQMLLDRGVGSLAINLSLGIDDRAAAMYDCPTPHTHRHTDAVDEIGAWVGWLQQQGVEAVALLGHSRGGNQTARYAAGNPAAVVSQVFLIAPATWEAEQQTSDYEQRYGTSLTPLYQQAEGLVAAGKGDQLMGPMGFIYCEGTRAAAGSVVSYYANDPDMDTPTLLPRIQLPTVIFAGTEDTAVIGLEEKVQPLADQGQVELVVMDGADHFFRDLYAEDLADIIVDHLGN
jgi:pimeloyl-ACP methyl ester carboxylesterase